ncbi:protein Z, vitamin K-dependent plasma glycoprotein b [Echeneis naucrates]|uniref:protein Z, vitamin K-dependent plasma glycoprotein b n=1 Tax=Echeneis naucrates TaxID=173247 RepID=UPI0011143498|nr:vitamin K-dependent protein Z-like [Echeneis naucrates]
MAVSIMSACCRASVLSLHLLACFLQVFSQGEVFVQETQANGVLVRSRRANMFLLEELLQGNLERECFEELCNYEEAREYFEDKEKTMAFWTVYYDGDQCKSNPCLNGGNCTDRVGGFYCLCTPPYSGPVCELGGLGQLGSSSVTSQHAADAAECPTEGPRACHQLCMASHFSFTCSCLPGFKLQTDKRSCVPEVDFPCGRLPDKFHSTESLCRHGNCPWQVPLLNNQGAELCAGVVLGHRSILTAASCVFLDSGLKLRPSSLFVVAGNNNQLVPVQALYVHDRFHPDHHDNDLALLQLAKPLTFDPSLIHLCVPKKDFSENILMYPGRTGVAEGWRSERHEDLVYMTLDECRDQMNVSHQLNNKMFCMSRQIGETVRQSAAPRGQARPGRNHNEDPQSWAPNGSDSQNSSRSKVDPQKPSVSDGGLRSEVSGRRSGHLLPGLPVATVEKGTAFLTGLLISPSTVRHGRGGGLVFTKVSRHLSWIRPRLEAAEEHMIPQVIQYPETR